MRTRYAKLIALFSCGLVMVLGILPGRLAAQVLHLQAGMTASVTSDQATCEHATSSGANEAPDGIGSVLTSACSGNLLTINLTSGIPAHAVSASATAEFVVQFQVDTQPGAPDASTLPVLIAVPVKWTGFLWNNNEVPPVGLAGLFQAQNASADLNASLFLTQGQTGDPLAQGAVVNSSRFLGALHSGIGGCLTSVPSDEVSAGITAAACVAATYQGETGQETVYLSAIIQTGQTYDLVLDLEGDIFTLTPLPGSPASAQPQVNLSQTLPTPYGLALTGPMTITIGTDFQGRIAGLQDQINQLRSSLATLRTEFLNHTHTYLTGKGVGQNNTVVTTSKPIIH